MNATPLYRYVPIPKPNEGTFKDGQAYKETREKQGISLQEMADIFGVSPNEIRLFEDGKGLLLQEGFDLTQHDDGSVTYRRNEEEG